MTPYNFNPNQYQTNPYQPYNMYTQSTQQQLIRVTGLDGAKAYQMNANSTVALFDNNEDLMYIKTTDGAGFPSIRTFKFEELQTLCKNQENNVPSEQYITRKEMEEYVKQFIPKQSNNTNKSEYNKSGKTVNE